MTDEKVPAPGRRRSGRLTREEYLGLGRRCVYPREIDSEPIPKRCFPLLKELDDKKNSKDLGSCNRIIFPFSVPVDSKIFSSSCRRFC
jgi:hypothetical protein